METPRVLLDNTFFSDLLLSDSPEDQARLSRIIAGVTSKYDVTLSSVVIDEATRAKGNPNYPKDRLVDAAISDALERINIEIPKAESLAYESRRLGAAGPSDAGFFPKNNLGERSIIEIWRPGDIVVSNDGFFDKVQHTDQYTKIVRPDLSAGMLQQIRENRLTTTDFINRAAIDGAISLDDHQAMARKYSSEPYLAADDIAHRQQLIADGHDPQAVHKLARSTELHAARGLGAASLAVNVGEGNYTAAAVDAAGMAADTKAGAAVVEAVAEGVAKIGPKAVFTAVAQGGKRLPVIGAVVTAGFVAYEVGTHIGQGEWQVAGAALAAGTAEAAGNIVGFGAGDAAREAARGTMIAVGGDEFAAVEKSGIRQLGEGAYALGERILSDTPATGKPLETVLPANYRSMTLGSDAMGERSEVGRIALERSGFAAGDPRNNLSILSSDLATPRAHLLILPDGSVQGPESGGVAFGNNPSIAAGVNGGTLGIMYAGTGAMNDAQYATMQSATEWLTAQRGRDGLTTPVEVIAGSLNTAQILQIPTPQGFTPGVAPEAGMDGPAVAPLQQRKVSNGMGGV